MAFLAGGGEMGERMRAFDWTTTPLGPPEGWPRSLKTAVGIMLASRQPFWIGWGPALTYLYNDPYLSIIGGKHPDALGQPTSVVWREIWEDISPLLSTALTGEQGTYVEAQLLIMERSGYPEETYYTFSYSPIPDDTGGVGGIICANTDDTLRVIGERRLALLRDLAAATGDARTRQEACERAAAALGGTARELPFALIYLATPEGQLALAASSGIEPGHKAAPPTVMLDAATPWPFADVLETGLTKLVTDLDRVYGDDLPTGAWPRPPATAAVMPIHSTGEGAPAGVLLAGLNPFRPFDESYRDFLQLVTSQIAAGIANAVAYEEERGRAEALAQLDRAKTTFFSNVSHEFRTPLTLLLGPVEDLLGGSASDLPAWAKHQLELVHRNGLRLLRLVNTLLDFSRIEAGRVQAVFQPTDLAEFTADLASMFRAAVERAGLRLAIECAPLPHPVYVDRDMWEKIVLNLLSNALKFTHEGQITVRVRAAGDAAVLEVQDTGTGIPAAEMPRLFERFHRVHSARGRTHEGSGIGLALVHELVGLHGGQVGAESALERGTTFTVRVPFGQAHLPAEQVRPAPAAATAGTGVAPFVEEAMRWLPETARSQNDGLLTSYDPAPIPRTTPAPAEDHRPRVLVVDDNADMRDYIARLLAEQYRVDTARDGLAALETAAGSPPDLVLTDVMMPRLDGLGLLRELRADPRTAAVPVILLSARAGEESRVEGLGTGADDYMVKPFSARELLARVSAHLQMAQLRHEATEALRESEARFRTLADTAPAMLWVTDPDGRCSFLSRGWYECTGQAENQGLGFGWLDAVHPEDRENAREIYQRAHARREPFSLDYRLRQSNGDYRWAVDAGRPRFAANGAYLGSIGSVIDIHDRKRIEEQLRQASKMEAIGRLAGGLAHDFNNQLQAVAGFARFVERDKGLSATARLDLGEIQKGAERMASLTRQLLAFSRQQVLVPEILELGSAVADTKPLLERLISPSVVFETETGRTPVWVQVDRSQLAQVLMNLAINARDAMPDGGTLRVSVSEHHASSPTRTENGSMPPGKYGQLTIRDTGVGIPASDLPHIFEPFFTTKGLGQGTGLGLSTVHGIVAQSRGFLTVESRPAEGTCFTIYFPTAAPPIVRPPAQPSGNSRDTHIPLRILLVDDEPSVRALLGRVLADEGHEVLLASGAREALAFLDREGIVDLVVSDVVMPGMSGVELGDILGLRYPSMPVVWMSGFHRDDAFRREGRRRAQPFLQKPVSEDALLEMVRSFAAARAGR